MNSPQTKKKKPVFSRIVVKLGTRLVTGGENHLDQHTIAGLVAQMAVLHGRGAHIVLVSSGAIASGRQKLGLKKRIRGIPYKQVLAAVGQSRLMRAYEELFGEHGITVAQALLTKGDLADRAGYLNARNTLLALMEMDVICIVNENDIVSIDEIKEAKFGDNDNLSAMVANLVDADLLILLTEVGGLYTADPSRHPEATLIQEVTKIDNSIKKMGAATHSTVGTGGMITKIEAAQLAMSSGVNVVIADGHVDNVIVRLAEGEAIGTRFHPTNEAPESRERWMISGLCTRGKLVVDEGAAVALRRNNRSLLAAGIQTAEGRFKRGDIVAIYDTEGNHLGCGITNYSSGDIGIIKGSRSDKIAGLIDSDYGPEVVHKNNLALLQREDSRGDRQAVSSQQR